MKDTVEKIKKNEEVDMIICVSHCGTWEDENKSEDELLAKNVKDIDLIISGHTHSELKEPIQHENTYILWGIWKKYRFSFYETEFRWSLGFKFL